MVSPIDVIIPTRSPPDVIQRLVDQISDTAGYPHRIVYTGADASAAANRNLGLDRSDGDMVAMVDDDIEFPPHCAGWLSLLVHTMSHPNVVMVSAQLVSPKGGFAYMTGVDDCGNTARLYGESIVPTKKVLTACCVFRHYGLRFDENYIGSGFEDIDFCHSLAALQPTGIFMVCHSAWAIHHNEQKNQKGRNWKANEDLYNKKWGSK
jgi:glycosyltransferase involved in cell wall biosynthesis